MASRLEGLKLTAALSALALATFAYVTTENLPVGLLPQLASGLHRSKAATGYLVTAYAAVVVVASVPLALATQRFSRRRLLLGSLTLFVVCTALGAAARTYGQLLATRMAIALSHAVFWAIVAATAAALVPRARRGRAFAIVFSGVSVASVVGVPATAWIGQHTSWRVSTLLTSALGLVALVAVAILLPETPEEHERAGAPRPHAGRYALTLVVLALTVSGALAFLTYVTVFLLSAGGFSSGAISPILLASGVAGGAGVLGASRLVGDHARATMAAAIAGVAVALLLLGAFAHHAAADVLLICLFGLALSVFAVAVQARTLDVSPGSVNVGGAGNSAVFNVGIGAGALLGGLLLQGPGIRSVPVAGGVLALVALALLAVEPLLIRN